VCLIVRRSRRQPGRVRWAAAAAISLLGDDPVHKVEQSRPEAIRRRQRLHVQSRWIRHHAAGSTVLRAVAAAAAAVAVGAVAAVAVPRDQLPERFLVAHDVVVADLVTSKRLVIESRWVSKPLAFAGELRPRRLNNQPSM
jgi:hypothetical protein